VGNLLDIPWNIKLFLEPGREIGEAFLADRVRDGILFVREVSGRVGEQFVGTPAEVNSEAS
jgi:hypothetical protein